MTTEFLATTGGTLAYDDTATAGGSGRSLLLCVPGLGETRGSYRHLTPLLAAAGYRVVTMDLRGTGESSTGWSDYGTTAIGADILALARHLDAGPIVLISNSYTGGPSILAAAQAPEAFSALVLTDPFARTPTGSPMRRFLVTAAGTVLGRFRPGWMAYWNSLFPTRKPIDHAVYQAALSANLAQPGRMAALRGMLASSQAPAAARAAQVRTPALVVMGSKDPDFPDPATEAAAVAAMIRGKVAMIENAGHYPIAEFPEETAQVIMSFLKETGI